jgi:hypothetical protein
MKKFKALFDHVRHKLGRTFRAHCPHCHRLFYGTEAYRENVKIGGVHYRIVCARCATRAG